MKKIYVISKPDIYTKNFLRQLEALPVKKDIEVIDSPDNFLNSYSPSETDIIILDTTLQEELSIDLYQLINEIRKIAPSVPIIIISLLKDYELDTKLSGFKNITFMLKLNDNKQDLEKLLDTNASVLSSFEKPAEKTRHKILVVDDFENTRFVVKFTLEKEGYLVVTAADGYEALQKIKTIPDIDLLIVDLNMPKMNGLQLIEEIRKEQILKDKPIIILTTEVDERKKERAKALKITGWIQKPYQLNEFLDIIKKVLK